MERAYQLNAEIIDDKSRIVFYGTGKKSLEKLEALISLGVVVSYIGDSNPDNYNTYIRGIKCISNEEISEIENCKVIIGSDLYLDVIRERLLSYGLDESQLYYDNLSVDMNNSFLGKI